MKPAKKKPGLAIVIGMGKPKGKEPEDMPDDDEHEDPDGDEGAHEDAMAEFNDAAHKGDLPRQIEAFKTLYDLCMAEHKDAEAGKGDEEY